MRQLRLAVIGLVVLALMPACGDRDVGPRKLSPAAENRIRGQHYCATNARKPGVVVAPSGLQYRVLTSADGVKPTLADTVTFHYRGTTIDGREFETSRDKGEKPLTAPVRELIRGWQEGLQLMPTGATYEFTIPSNLAYGLSGRPPAIGPNQTLIFTIELIGVNLPAPVAAPAPLGGQPPEPSAREATASTGATPAAPAPRAVERPADSAPAAATDALATPAPAADAPAVPDASRTPSTPAAPDASTTTDMPAAPAPTSPAPAAAPDAAAGAAPADVR